VKIFARGLLTIFFCLSVLAAASLAQAQPFPEILVDNQGVWQRVPYHIYVPPVPAGVKVPVLVCVGGLPSGPDECTGPQWRNFSNRNRVAILGVGFTFVPEDWPAKTSYQYAQAWSGKALLKILDIVGKKNPALDAQKLYMFGISAGAQFCLRFAQMRPDLVRAVAAHASGGYDYPKGYIPTRFLITVGELDNQEIKRLDMAREFVELCRQQGIDVRFEVIPGLTHRQTQKQDSMSRQFFFHTVKQGQ